MGRGKGKGGGRGSGQGPGRKGGTKAAGPGGKCTCPRCRHEVLHQTGKPCYDVKCAKCGTQMTRD